MFFILVRTPQQLIRMLVILISDTGYYLWRRLAREGHELLSTHTHTRSQHVSSLTELSWCQVPCLSFNKFAGDSDDAYSARIQQTVARCWSHGYKSTSRVSVSSREVSVAWLPVNQPVSASAVERCWSCGYLSTKQCQRQQ